MSINVLVNILNTCFLKKNLRGGLECTCILDIFKTCVANHCQGVGVRGGCRHPSLNHVCWRQLLQWWASSYHSIMLMYTVLAFNFLPSFLPFEIVNTPTTTLHNTSIAAKVERSFNDRLAKAHCWAIHRFNSL